LRQVSGPVACLGRAGGRMAGAAAGAVYDGQLPVTSRTTLPPVCRPSSIRCALAA